MTEEQQESTVKRLVRGIVIFVAGLAVFIMLVFGVCALMLS